MICPNCGFQNQPGDDLCGSCGVPLKALETLTDAETAESSRATMAAPPPDVTPPNLPPAKTVPPETVPPTDTAPRDVPPADAAPRDVPPADIVPPALSGAAMAGSPRPTRHGGPLLARSGLIRRIPVIRVGISGPRAAEVAAPATTGTSGPRGAGPDALTQVGLAIAVIGVGVAIIAAGGLGTVLLGGRLQTTASPGVAVSVTTASPRSGAASEDSPPPREPLSTPPSESPVVHAPESTPGSPAAPTASAVATAAAATRERVALRTDTPVAWSWRDSAGTVRVHVVVAASNDTSDVLSLAATERTFRLISAAGRTVHAGRFAYAFPFVVPPGGTSYLITTAVLPYGVDATNVRVEAEILADITTAVQSMLEVSDLRLVSNEGRPGVRGIVRNTGAEDVTFGVVAVIGRDASGLVIGGLYDNVNVASIAPGGEATFQTEYPGLPPAAAGRIADLSGVAFDVGYQP
jgi:hypothetical protein